MLKSDDGGGASFMYGDIARSFGFGDMLGMSSSTDNEVMVLQSHTVLRETAVEMGLNTIYQDKVKFIIWRNLFEKTPVKLVTPPLMGDTLSTSLMFNLKKNADGDFSIKVKAKKKTILNESGINIPCTLTTPYGEFKIEKTDYFDNWTSSKLRITLISYDAAAELYVKLVNVFAPSRKTDFITLSTLTTDPEFGKKLLSTIIDNYNQLGNDEKNSRTVNSLRLVNERLATLSKEMVETEEKMENFKRDNKLTDVEYDAQMLLGKSGDIESSLIKVQTENEILKLTLDYISNKDNNYSLIPDLIPGNNAITNGQETAKNQIQTYNELILARMRLTSSAKENNSSIRLIDNQIDALRDNIKVSVKRAYDNSTVALNDLKRENNKVSGRINEIPSLERQYLEIKRIAELQNQMYMFLLQQKEEYTLNMASRTISAVTIDQPHALVEPVGLTKKKILALGFLIGLLLPAAFLMKFRLKRIPCSNIGAVKSATKAPILGGISQCSDDGTQLAVLSNACRNGENIRKLRSDLSLVLDECGGKTVLVTSPNQREGKTLLAINLAASYCLIGKKVLLIDGNMRDPQDARELGISAPTPALAQYVTGKRPQIEICHAEIGDNATLDVITGAQTNAHPADIIGSEKTAALINSLKDSYDIIIIDGSSLNDYSETYYWASVTDVTLMLARKDITVTEDIKMVEDLFKNGRLPRIAIVTNGL